MIPRQESTAFFIFLVTNSIHPKLNTLFRGIFAQTIFAQTIGIELSELGRDFCRETIFRTETLCTMLTNKLFATLRALHYSFGKTCHNRIFFGKDNVFVMNFLPQNHVYSHV